MTMVFFLSQSLERVKATSSTRYLQKPPRPCSRRPKRCANDSLVNKQKGADREQRAPSLCLCLDSFRTPHPVPLKID
jgi:hypothetical protein